MSDFRPPKGFEDAKPAPRLPFKRAPATLLSPHGGSTSEARARLARVANRAPEVLVKVNGRIHGQDRLRAHLDYISRKGELEIEDRDGVVIAGRAAVKDLADDWAATAEIDARRRSNTPLGLALVPSMPPGTDVAAVHDAARAFARESFERFDYVLALHDDAPNPHGHLTIRWVGRGGEHLRPGPADLETWRQVFAQALRDRGVEAEATPRWARGVTRRSERTPIRKLREQYEAGEGPAPKVLRAAYHEAAKAAFLGQEAPTSWERRMVERQAKVRRHYLDQAQQLAKSPDPADQALGQKLEAFVREMPAPDSQRLALARELRAANEALRRQRDRKERDREEELER